MAGGWVVSVRIVFGTILSCTVRCGTASFLHGSVRNGKLPALFGAVRQRFGAVRRNCIVETPMLKADSKDHATQVSHPLRFMCSIILEAQA